MSHGLSAGLNNEFLYVGLTNGNRADGAIAWGDEAAGALRFIHVIAGRGEGEAMRITGKGFVGIGTQAPKATLEVSGGILAGAVAVCNADNRGHSDETWASLRSVLMVCGTFVVDGGNIIGSIRGQDGAGSGLDADLLDGLDSTAFVQTKEDVVRLLKQAMVLVRGWMLTDSMD